MKRLFQLLVNYIFRIFMCVIVATTMLTIVYMIPAEYIHDCLDESVGALDYEGTYPSLYNWCVSTLDNYTDAIMLSEAYYEGENPFVSALESNIYTCNDMDPVQTIVRLFWEDLKYDSTYAYSRYWHGYLIILKPLLMFFNYSTIRKINGVVQIGLIATLFVLFVQCKEKKFIMPFLVAYLMAVPVALMKSLQFSNCFYVMLIGSIAMMLLKKQGAKKEKYFLLFLYIGIATSFFDLLTYPILTFGIPCLIFVLMNSKKHRSFLDVCNSMFAWGAGYLGMWISKWILASCFTEKNVIEDALASISERLSHTNMVSEIEYTVMDSLTLNFRNYFNSPMSFLFWISIAILLLFCVARKKDSIHVLKTRKFLFSSVVTLLPVFWYAGVVNHSTIHAWYTKNACFVVVFGVLSTLFVVAEVEILNCARWLKNCRKGRKI